MSELSQNKKFNKEWLKTFPKWNWYYNEIYENPNFKIEWVLQLQVCWDYQELSLHDDITLSILDELYDRPGT